MLFGLQLFFCLDSLILLVYSGTKLKVGHGGESSSHLEDLTFCRAKWYGNVLLHGNILGPWPLVNYCYWKLFIKVMSQGILSASKQNQLDSVGLQW